jgi:hypothetical protein
MSEAFQDIGPTALPRFRVHTTAREVLALAKIAVDASTQGPRCDVRRAERKLGEIRDLLNEAPE